MAPGSVAPDFELPAAGAGRPTLGLGDLVAGMPAVLAFFKTSCPVCRLSFPVWAELRRRYRPAVAAAAVSQDSLGKARRWLDGLGYDGVVLDDSAGYGVSGAFGVRTVPTLVLVGTDRQVVDTLEGWDRTQANAWDLALAERTGIPSTGPLSDPADGLPESRPG